MKINNIEKIIVKYNGKIVGYLAQLDNLKIGFQYDDEWVKNGFSISPFSLPLGNKVYTNTKDTFNGLFGVFADSLPDGWGELLFRRNAAKNGINADRLSPLTRLSLISNNGLGALTYEPSQYNEEGFKFDLDKVASDAAKLYEDEMDSVNFDRVYSLGGSSGGARPKVHIKDGNDFWIVKFPCRIDPPKVGVLEFQVNKLAKDCGININEHKLFQSKVCDGYFGAKRFDRQGDKRVHTISLSALLETTHRIPNLDYLHLFQVIQNICKDKSDLYEAYKRMCFNVLLPNRDDHGKNFAFVYDEQKDCYKLSPAYDITLTKNKVEHEMTVNGNGLPSEKDLLEVAKIQKLSIEECKKIIEKIKKTIG